MWSKVPRRASSTYQATRKALRLYYPESVSEKTKLTLAALASAAMPDVPMTGARDCDQISHRDRAEGISCAVVQDSTGNTYDVWATDQEAGKKRMAARVKAARALEDAKEVAAMGFRVERVLAYEPGLSEASPTGKVSVTVLKHSPGRIRPLHLLTINECTAAGTAIGAIHRIRPEFLGEHGYPAFTTSQISSQLKGWITRLRKDGHVPEEITNSWASIAETDGLWSFDTCTVHGGFTDGDLLYSNSGLSSIYGWQDMQVNDPARDLAWIFSKLDGSRRNAVIAAYGRMVGSRLDDLIMLRANLWLQMEQVGEFITALDRADNERIIQFKAQVERLAQQLSEHEQLSHARQNHKPARPAAGSNPSTITVGNLLGGENDPAKPESGKTGSAAPNRPTVEPKDDQGEAEEPADDSSVTIAINKVDMADLARTQTAMNHQAAKAKEESKTDHAPVTEADSSTKSKSEPVSDEKTATAEGEPSGEGPAVPNEDGIAHHAATQTETTKDKAAEEPPLTGAETIIMPRKPSPDDAPTRTTDGIISRHGDDA